MAESSFICSAKRVRNVKIARGPSKGKSTFALSAQTLDDQPAMTPAEASTVPVLEEGACVDDVHGAYNLNPEEERMAQWWGEESVWMVDDDQTCTIPFSSRPDAFVDSGASAIYRSVGKVLLHAKIKSMADTWISFIISVGVVSCSTPY